MKSELVRTDKWIDTVARVRCAAREADELSVRHISCAALLSVFDDDGNELTAVELTTREWHAVRRYLRRNRLRLIQKATSD